VTEPVTDRERGFRKQIAAFFFVSFFSLVLQARVVVVVVVVVSKNTKRLIRKSALGACDRGCGTRGNGKILRDAQDCGPETAVSEVGQRTSSTAVAAPANTDQTAKRRDSSTARLAACGHRSAMRFSTPWRWTPAFSISRYNTTACRLCEMPKLVGDAGQRSSP
jgi:hypothetical protein